MEMITKKIHCSMRFLIAASQSAVAVNSRDLLLGLSIDKHEMYLHCISERSRCRTPGCTRPKHRRPSGGYYDYCSIGCRDRRSTQVSSLSGLLFAQGSCCLQSEELHIINGQY